MSMFNKFAVVIAFAICTTNAWAGDVMKNDPNAIGILDCVWGVGDDGVAIWQEENLNNCASGNSHTTKAIWKKFVADAYYNKYKNDTGMAGGERWPDNVNKLPELIDGRYMLRCVATECEDGYELARDKKGNSMGWCRKKTAQGNVFNITLKNGQKINNLFAVDFMYADDTGKVYGIITYVDDTPSSDVYFEMGDVSRIDDKDVSSFLSGAKTGHIDSTSWYIYECDTKNGYIAAEQIDVRDKLQHWTILSKPECGASSSVGIQCENIPFYKKCVKKSNNGESESETTSATVFDDLDKFISEKFVGSSVWKNDEGNFNTARLVSDSVAGVVLGTVGGVITSHIIKKNQIENGFDDLKCTIGGQTVASYGDEFRVGVK